MRLHNHTLLLISCWPLRAHRITYSRGNMYSNRAGRFYPPWEPYARLCLSRLCTLPSFLHSASTLTWPGDNCARTGTSSTNVCRDTLPHQHAHADPSQILRQVARTTKPLQQLSPLGSRLYDNSCHSTPMMSDFLVFGGGSQQWDPSSH